MNHPAFFLLVALLAFTGVARAQQDFQPDAPPPKHDRVQYTLLKPSDKTFEMVKTSERNPFAKLDDGVGANEKAINQENQIREKLDKLRVVGVSPGENGLRVMLGDIVLESGKMVPPLLPEQTVALRVGTISPQAIELLWMEERPAGAPLRKLTIGVDLRPYVRYQLKGQPTEKNQWEKQKSDAEIKTNVGRLFPASAVGASRFLQSPGTSAPAAVAGEEPAPSGTDAAALRSLSTLEGVK